MAKPIFIVEVPYNISVEQIKNIQEIIKIRFPDYNTLGIQHGGSTFKFHLFNDENSKSVDLYNFMEKIINANENKYQTSEMIKISDNEYKMDIELTTQGKICSYLKTIFDKL